MIRLTIGNLHIQLEGIDRAYLPANTLLFESTFEEADLYYTFHTDRQPRLPNTPPIYRKPDILVFRQPSELESRLLILPDSQTAYAYLEEKFLLLGKRHAFRIGDKIRVRAAACHFDSYRVEFSFLGKCE